MTDQTDLTEEDLNELRSAMQDNAAVTQLIEQFREARLELEAFEFTFDLRWKADRRAIERWQKAHPGKENIWPDHADLVVWLMGQLDARKDP